MLDKQKNKKTKKFYICFVFVLLLLCFIYYIIKNK